ncbi:hypothetical protein [Pseudomonas sp. NPDC089406]|uniref:hypothetical protein n=1 Tax=Pseudomonas sp. NPDC089406 TaxID=3364463 RepID=UPI00385089E4
MINANFTAELHCRHGQIGVADTSFSDHFITSAVEDGWLCTQSWRPKGREQTFKAVRFAFSFIEQAGDRTHYHITCIDNWDYKEAKLERNSNGWLGLYGTHVVGRLMDALNPANMFGRRGFWKIQQLSEWDGDLNSIEAVDFYLRDHLGHQVSRTKNDRGPEFYLNAGIPGFEILKFTLKNVELE